jgi:membrane associated rhomboid family serine protease
MFDRITPMVKNLLIINIGFFIFFNVVLKERFESLMAFYTPFLPNSDYLMNPNFKSWQFVSYMFLHGNIGHLLSNMFGLFIFGSSIENFMGSKKFLIYYIICGVGAALINSGVNFYQMSQMIPNSEIFNSEVGMPMVGASGAIFGILIAFGFLFPNVEMMLLFFPFPIKAKYFVTLYGLYELFRGTSGAQTGIAHFAHIGGLITGLILLKFLGFGKRFY